MRSKSEIEKRLHALKSRQKDKLDVRSDIEPLEYMLIQPEITEEVVKQYACDLIKAEKFTQAQSVIWVLQPDYKNNAINHKEKEVQMV